MNISIFGLGYVGCVGMACLARQGHRMIGVDTQLSKVDFINAGKPTIIEKDVEQLLSTAHAAGLVSATDDVREAIRGSDVSFLCVGTPPTQTGQLDLAAIYNVAEKIGQALREKIRGSHHVIAVRSTVLPGTRDLVSSIIAEASGRKSGEDFAVVSNPEFLREGSSVADFQNPPFTLVGSDCDWATEMMKEVYAALDADFIVAVPKVAELMKYVCNSFHALKITFANEVGNVCKKLGIDSHELMEIFCRDTRLNISSAYLKPGFAYGGSCLPKDLRALRTIAHDHYVQTPVFDAIERSNELQKQIVLDWIIASGKRDIAFIGLAFKAGTDDLRESPIVDVIERLLGKGFNVRIYDPNVHLSHLTGANRDYILSKIPFISRFVTDDIDQVLRDSEVVVIVNKEPGLSHILNTHAIGAKIYDLARINANSITLAGYQGLSW